MAAILFLKRNGFDLYTSALNSTISSEIPTTIFQDLELLNSDEFYNHIRTFIETNNITGASTGMIILHSSVYFEKDIPAEQTSDQQNELIEQFVSNAPFNTPNSKTYPIDKNQKVVVANGDILEALRIAFAKVDILFTYAIPAFLAAPELDNMGSLSTETAKTIAKKYDSLKQQGMIIMQEIITPRSSESSNAVPEKSNKTLIIVGVVFILLGLGGSIFIFMKQQQEMAEIKKNRKRAAPTKIIHTPTPTATPLVEASPSAELDTELLSTLRVQILNGTNIPGQANGIRAQLLKLGFKNIQTGNASGVTLSRTLIVFSQEVPAAVRARVTEEVKNASKTNVTTQESAQASFDIIITIVQPTLTPTTIPE